MGTQQPVPAPKNQPNRVPSPARFRAHNTTVVTAPPPVDQRLKALKAALFCATDDQRLAALSDYCTFCGKFKGTATCHCANDE